MRHAFDCDFAFALPLASALALPSSASSSIDICAAAGLSLSFKLIAFGWQLWLWCLVNCGNCAKSKSHQQCIFCMRIATNSKTLAAAGQISEH